MNRSGGGIGFLFKQNIIMERMKTTSFSSFEYMEFLLRSSSSLVRLVIVYRPPSSSKNLSSSTAHFFQKFSSLLESLSISSGKLIIAGDFNFHIDNLHDNNARRFIDLIDCFNRS